MSAFVGKLSHLLGTPTRTPTKAETAAAAAAATKQNLKVRVEKPREMKCIQRAPSQPEKLLHQHPPVHPAKSADS